MISYYKKFKFLKIKESWFGFENGSLGLFKLKIYNHVGKHEIMNIKGIKKITHTVELSLTDDADLILSKFRNTVKQEIRKSEKEGVICSFNEKDTTLFIKFYNDFAKAKNIDITTAERIAEMQEYFTITFAKLNGELLAAHSYIVDNKSGIVRLFHSASRRLDETMDRNIIGRANKLLTSKDIFHFKEQGYKTMDFGGYADNTEDKSLKGINEFKLSFGGEKIICNNYYSLGYHFLKSIAAKFGALGNA